MLSSGLNLNSVNASNPRKLGMPLHDPSERTVPAIARRLIATRLALGLSQAALSRRTGVATNTYNQYEKEKGRPDLDNAMRLCDGLGITLDWIYRADASGLPARIADRLPDVRPPDAPGTKAAPGKRPARA